MIFLTVLRNERILSWLLLLLLLVLLLPLPTEKNGTMSISMQSKRHVRRQDQRRVESVEALRE
jgi:hypothetical protein